MSDRYIENMQVVVLMGGLGTRLGLPDCPKALAEVEGSPFFDYELNLLKAYGFKKFLFLVGYQSEQIEQYYKDGSKHCIEITYSYDGKTQLGTGGALKNANNLLEDQFVLIYGDSFMDIDYRELVYRFLEERLNYKIGLMAIMHNKGQYDKSNVIFHDGELELYDKKTQNASMEYIDYGVMVLSKEILEYLPSDGYSDIADALHGLSVKRSIAGQIVGKRFYEIGSQNAYKEFCRYAKDRYKNKKKAVFFDRDGVVNELVFNDDIEQLDSPFSFEDVRYSPGIKDVFRELNKKGVLIYIITNQPAAAKGKVPLRKIYGLNREIVSDLDSNGISIEFAKICPHHDSKNHQVHDFLTQDCECRKPKTGMIDEILKTNNIDLSNSYIVGDSYTDIIAGQKKGLKTVFVGNYKCDICNRLEKGKPDFIVKSCNELLEVIKKI